MGQSLGQGSLGLSQKKEASGAPFPAGSADNGLSVDSVSGKIVLGQVPGEAGNPGAIITSREIPFASGTELSMLDSAARPMFFINEPFNVIAFGFDLNASSNPRIAMQPGPSIVQITGDNLTFTGVIKWLVSIPLPARSGASNVLVHNKAGGADGDTIQEIAGASGTFTTTDGKTVTVLDGIITAIV